jgi:hypothetical protein
MKNSDAIDMLKQGLAIGMDEYELVESVINNANGKIGTYPATKDYVEKLLKDVKKNAPAPVETDVEAPEQKPVEADAKAVKTSDDNVWEEWECRKTADGAEKRKLRKTVKMTESVADSLNANPLTYGADIVMYFKKEAQDA